MPITDQQIQIAQARQYAAAHDPGPQIRLVSGPGTGKSYAIEERVRWLLDEKSTPPERIFVVSFTRAASTDLRSRVQTCCRRKGLPGADRVSVSTLHSLALRALRKAGLLHYPADPLIMDKWEFEKVLDKEFSFSSGYRRPQTGTGRPATEF